MSDGESRPEGDARPRAELKEAALAGVRWVTLARVGGELVMFGSMIVLARLVSPSEFGHLAVAMILNAIALLVASSGVGTPIVQRPSIERRDLESAALISLGLGALLCAASLFLVPLVCRPLFGADTADLMVLMAPIFVITAIGVVGQSQLQRRLDFKRLSVIEVSGLVSGAVCSVALAIAGLDAEAIVIGTLVAAGVSSACYLLAGGPVLPRWHRAAARQIIAFGVPSALSSLATMAHRNVDYAILAAKMSPAQVGFYWRAFQLGVEHQRKISGIMMRMALPVYSRAASIEDMRAMRSRIVRVQATVIIPLLATFIVVAPTLIPWLLGSRWEPSVLPAQILAVAGMASAVLTGLGPLMFAIGRPGALLRFNVASFPVFGLVVFVSAGSGLTAVCVGAAGFYVLQLLAAHWLLLRRLAGIPMRSVVEDVAPGIVSSAVLIGSALPATALLRDAGAPATVELVVVPAFAAAVYCLVLRGAFPAAFADFATLVRGVTGRRRWRRPSLGTAQDPSRTPA